MSTTISANVAETVRSEFNFTVDKFRLSGPDNMRTPHFGLFRSDSLESVGVAVREGYEPHTVDDVCAMSESAAAAFPGESVANCLFRDGHFVTVAPSKEYRQSIFGTADNIWPRLIVRAGYDGRAFTATLGYYRDACRNMSVIRTAGRSVVGHIRHTGSLRGRMEDLQRQFRQLAGGWDSVVETARQMEASQVDLASFLRQVYPVAADATQRTQASADARIESIVRRIMSERVATGRPRAITGNFMVSAWEAFNGVQGYVQHDQRRHGKPGIFERVAIALDDSAVSRALELALAV